MEHSPRTSQSELKPEHKISLGTSPFEDSVLYVDDLIESTEPKSTLTLAIISRRSRYRAGWFKFKTADSVCVFVISCF